MSLDGNNGYFTGRWDHKLELSQEMMNTPSNMGKGVNLLK